MASRMFERASLLSFACRCATWEFGADRRIFAALAIVFQNHSDLIRQAIRMHVAGIVEDGDPVPEPKTIAEYIVAA